MPGTNIFIYTVKPVWVLDILRKNVKIVIAGGGIVFNEKEELLMIHRKGKWDLPKGKIDAGEKIVDGAVREVVEETGVQIESVAKIPVVTYHAYVLKDKKCLKETSWYEMKAKPVQDKPVPQAEEQIDEVRWVKKADLRNYEPGSFPLIRDLLQIYYPN
jgi:8-oxo-dGTP pyrophosphatase MutT (NUDIX family)